MIAPNRNKTTNKRGPKGPSKYTPAFLSRLAKKMVKWFRVKKNIWLKDFAIKHGITTKHMAELAEKSEEFKEAFELCKDIQESKLVQIGLCKSSNASMAIFALKNVCGWRDVTPDKPQEKDSPLIGEDIEILQNNDKNRIARIQGNLQKYVMN